VTARVTPLVLSLLSVAAWALVLAIASARADLFLVALPLLGALATLARPRRAPEYALSHEIESDRLFEGERTAVTVTIVARSAIPLMEVLESLPAGSEVVGGRNRALFALRAGQTVRWRYEIHCALRGLRELGRVEVRVRDRWALSTWAWCHVDAKAVHVYPRIAPLRSLPRPVHITQASIGDYVSPALGEGIEPGDIREFAPGDRLKQVNWRASLRLGTLYVTQHHRERNAHVVIMLDTLAEVGRAPDTTLDLGVRVAASLATGYLARKDRVGLINYGGLIHWVRPGSGRIQYERLADALSRASVVFTYVAKDLAMVPPRVLPPQALVIAVTSLLDPRFITAVLDLTARGFDLVVLVVSPVEVTRATVPPSPGNDLACRLWHLERRARLGELRRQGLRVVEWRHVEPLELALSGLGRRRSRLARTG
jgi:uncharacterized protein (DUF58 family)